MDYNIKTQCFSKSKNSMTTMLSILIARSVMGPVGMCILGNHKPGTLLSKLFPSKKLIIKSQDICSSASWKL